MESGLPRSALAVALDAFSRASGVIIWEFPRSVAEAAILARAVSDLAGFDVRLRNVILQECPQKYLLRSGRGLPHTMQTGVSMEYSLSQCVFDGKAIPADLVDCFEPAECGKCYVCRLVEVFHEVKRVLRDDGTLWLNLGDSYNAYNGNRGASASFQAASEEALPDLPPGNGLTCKGLKNKDLVGIPWMVAFALRADGWYLRQDIIWAKKNCMPESVTDRCTKSHEYVFLLSKSPRYYYDAEAIKEPVAPSQVGRVRDDVVGGNKGDLVHHSPGGQFVRARGGKSAFRGQGHFRDRDGGPANRDGRDMGDVGVEDNRNRRDVWTIGTKPYPEAHFAVWPEALVQPMILAGCPEGGVVLDPFAGSGTTGAVALKLGRRATLIELNPAYVILIRKRCRVTLGLPGLG